MNFAQILISLIGTLFFTSSMAVEVDEKILSELSRKSSLNARQVHVGQMGTQVELRSFEDRFQPQFFTDVQRLDSEEKSIASFVPKFGPVDKLKLGVKKYTRFGTDYSISAFTDQQSTVDNSISEATTTGYSVAVNFDLWKDFLGKTTRSQLKSKKLQVKKNNLENLLHYKSNEIEVRKVYWSIVANIESQKITERLLRTAKEQLAVAIRKKRNSVSDDGDVARYRAQLATRQGTLAVLKYQREQLVGVLKNQLPSLNGKEIQILPYNLDKTVSEVMQCTRQIKAYKKVPWENTSIDDLLKVINEDHREKKFVNSKYSNIDLKLATEYHVTGVDDSYSKSSDDLSSNGKSGYSVGLSLSIPLGSQKSDTEKSMQNLQEQQFQLERLKYMQRATTEHEQIVPLIDLLEASARTQQENSQNLQRSVRSIDRKYRQARVDINRLVNDQNALMQSLLLEVETQLRIIHILLDYFKTFHETPCQINKIG